MTYAEKLQDPRWQKKRLEVLQRDDFTCRCCKCKDQILHVHHIFYSNNPWESDQGDLITYCKRCHILVEFIKRTYKRDILKSYFVDTSKLHYTPLYFIKIGDMDTDANDRVVLIEVPENEAIVLTFLLPIQVSYIKNVFESNTNDGIYV